MDYEKMAKAKLIEILKSLQSEVDTTTDSLLAHAKQTSDEQKNLLYEIQILHERLKTRDLEIQKLQRELEKTRKRYVSTYGLSETANDAVFIVDPETGIILDVNRHAEILIGIPASEITGLHFTRLHPEEEVGRYKEYFEEHFQGKEGKVDVDDLVICHKDGRRIKVEISTNIIELEGGKRIIHGVFRDITDRKQEAEMFTFT